VTLDHFYTAFCKSYGAFISNACEEEDKEEIRQVREFTQLFRAPIADYLSNSGL
jgi:hypothetical protein